MEASLDGRMDGWKEDPTPTNTQGLCTVGGTKIKSGNTPPALKTDEEEEEEEAVFPLLNPLTYVSNFPFPNSTTTFNYK